MRVYVRHPSEFPVALVRDGNHPVNEQLQDVSPGGLCCRVGEAYAPGERVRVHIPLGSPGFMTEGRVVWCHEADPGYRVGIAFTNDVDAFRTRMVEQVCHIERYRRYLQAEGREATPEEAAAEWIGKYAERFPGGSK